MHLYLREQLARQHEHELRRAAAWHRPPVPRHRRSARQRAGWALTEIGLALAYGAGDG
jgi:hypothetical protein